MNGLVMTAADEGQRAPMNGLPVVTGSPGMASTVVFAFGDRAIEAVSGAIELGQQWWGAAPMVWRLDVAGQSGGEREGHRGVMGSLRQQLSLLCAEVAAARDERWQRNHQGNGYGEAAVLALWVVVDLGGAETESGRCVGERRGVQALQALQMMDVVAWQRLQVAIRPRVLLLAQPGDQESLDGCRQRLEVMAPEPYWVVGLAAEAAEATQRVGQSVATLFWGGAPLATTTEMLGRKAARYYVVGSGARTLPTIQLQQAVGLWGLAAALRESEMVTAEAEPGPAEVNDGPQVRAICTWVEQLLTEWRALADETPKPVAVEWGRGRPRWWRQALAPVRMLLAQRQAEQGALRAAQRRARLAWLTRQLSAWDERWQRWQRAWLTSRWTVAKGEADGGYAAALAQVWRCVLPQVQAIDEELARCADVTTQTQEAVRACSAAVEAACEGVPTLSLAGVWQWCTQPGQWGHWLWTLLVRLPRRLRELAQAVAACETAVYAEANIQVVRQLGLAILQDVQVQQRWLPKLRAHLREATRYADGQLAESVAGLPAPWTMQLVAALWQELRDSAGEQAGRDALDGWLQQEAAEAWAATGPEGVVTSVAATFAESGAGIGQWSAAEWLTAMFPPASGQGAGEAHGHGRNGSARTAPPKEALWTWLDGLAAEAQPQWPEKEAGLGWGRQAVTQAEGWLLLPMATHCVTSGDGGEEAPGDVERVLVQQQREEGVMAWLKAQRGWQRGVTPLPAVVAVRRRVIE
jgi:hypothetical protein